MLLYEAGIQGVPLAASRMDHSTLPLHQRYNYRVDVTGESPKQSAAVRFKGLKSVNPGRGVGAGRKTAASHDLSQGDTSPAV